MGDSSGVSNLAFPWSISQEKAEEIFFFSFSPSASVLVEFISIWRRSFLVPWDGIFSLRTQCVLGICRCWVGGMGQCSHLRCFSPCCWWVGELVSPAQRACMLFPVLVNSSSWSNRPLYCSRTVCIHKQLTSVVWGSQPCSQSLFCFKPFC